MWVPKRAELPDVNINTGAQKEQEFLYFFENILQAQSKKNMLYLYK